MTCLITHAQSAIDGNVHLWRSDSIRKWCVTLQDVGTGQPTEHHEVDSYMFATILAHDAARRHNTHVMELRDPFLLY